MKVAESIEQAGRRVGAHAWVAARLFEVTGRWSTTVDDPRARVRLGVASRRYGWHAELWHGLLPAVPHLGVDDLVAPPDDLAPLLAEIDELDTADLGDRGDDRTTAGDGDADTEKLTSLAGRVLPAVVDDLERHLAVTTPVTDGPTIRVLTLVLADLRADLQAFSSWSPPRSGG
jgi:hypothetical protein